MRDAVIQYYTIRFTNIKKLRRMKPTSLELPSLPKKQHENASSITPYYNFSKQLEVGNY